MVFEVLKLKASSVLRLLVLLTTILLFLSQVVLVGGPQESVKLEASPDIVETWAQVVNWTDPQDGETSVPLNKTIRVAVLGNYTLGNQVDWTSTPIVSGWVLVWTSDFLGNPVLEMYHDPFELCTVYTINITFYDDLMNPYDPYEFSFTTICGPQPPTPSVLLSAVLGGVGNRDVILTWNLSADDGAGDDNIANYAIYHSSNYHWDGEAYEFLATVPAGTSGFAHSLAGDGDSSNHFYYVQANNTDGETNWTGQAGKFVRHLEEGKQIASIPLVQEDTTLEVVLQTLEGSYKHVRYYKSSDQSHHWKSYWTFKTYRTLFEINHTMGFWIDMTKADYLVVTGLVPEVTYIDLGHEWNFIGYPSFIERTVSKALADVDWMKAQGYDDVPPFHLRQLTGNGIMCAGEGYWVWVDLPQVWEVSNKPSPPPYIVWTYPLDGEKDVPLNVTVLVKFSKEMNTSSVNWVTIPDPAGYSQYWSEGNTLLEIHRTGPWPENTTITFEVISGEDLEGDSLVPGPVPNPWSFTTGLGEAPHVVMTDPYDYEQYVGLWRNITIRFSTEIVPHTFHWNVTPDPGGWTETWDKTVYNNDTVTLIHANPFDPSSNVSVIIEHAKDGYGRDLEPRPHWFSFYTAGYGVYILSTSPSHQEINVPLNECIVIVFSEPMDPTTVTFTIMPTTPVTAAWFANDTILEICPVP
ncbi:MAG: Ig-like domain-containing protein, partial [Thermoplasmata archaeon]|nr:Ig-like domain-containing protein [Thermoplasmata archaeon]